MASEALKKKYAERIAELVAEGEKLLKQFRDYESHKEKCSHVSAESFRYQEITPQPPFPERDEWTTWNLNAAAICAEVLPSEHLLAAKVQEMAKWTIPSLGIHETAMGRLRAVQANFGLGFFDSTKLLIHAELAIDYLEQAEFVLKSGYAIPAVVLTGAVLEDALRTLAIGNGIPTTKSNGDKLTINPLNDELVRVNVYQLPKKQQITAWAALRNNAAHGNSPAPTPDEAKLMIAGVRSFLADYLK